MSVSVSEHTDVDLDAIVAGGDAFMTRVKMLQKAKADSIAALESLNIGNDVAAAMRDAQAREATAIKLIEDAKVEADGIVVAATAKAASITSNAQVEADALLAAARKETAAIEQEVKTARTTLQSWSEKTTAEGEAVLTRANAAQAKADRQLAANQKAADELAKARAEAKAATDRANATQAAVAAKLEAIKAAAS